jgi:hypothetical protein
LLSEISANFFLRELFKMKKTVFGFLLACSFLSVSVFAQQRELIFKGGHSIQFYDSLFISSDSLLQLTENLSNWSPFLNNIKYSVSMYSEKENLADGIIKFKNYLGGANFTGGKYFTDTLPFGSIETRILFTQNYNDYKAKTDCRIESGGEYFLVSSIKGMNSSSEYYEKFGYWYLKVNNDVNIPAQQLSIKTNDNETQKAYSVSNDENPDKIIGENKKHSEPEYSGCEWKAGAGVSFATRYFWRGLDLTKSPAVAPEMAVSYGPCNLSICGVYGLSEKIPEKNNELTEYSRLEMALSYSFGSYLGGITAGIKNYFMPYQGIKFFNFDDNRKGAHTPEINLEIDNIMGLPIMVFGAVNVYNDPDNSWYLEAGYTFKIK